MDLQTVKTRYGTHWAWARTGALILFLLTGMLFAVSLTAHSRTSATAPAKAGVSITALLTRMKAG